MTAPALAALYQSLVLAHNRTPRHLGTLVDPSHHAVGVNPLCGDRLELWLKVGEGRIVEVGHHIEASALTRAMSSMMAERVHGLPILAARELATRMLADCRPGGMLERERVGDLADWQGVLGHPNRIKSLTLPWATLLAALDGQGQASTET
ncbi:MAG: iron-sulfur cluster assembly scaffold protein [Xanthomonadales bacterium]|jgi:nitrogen fixation NifU-like protein|nr:iron-sulfur cluster assembly scaffold protein [Xanthomonadales bacterium]